MKTKEKIKRGSGNVFCDLGVHYPGRALARAQVMHALSEIIRRLGWTQQQASKMLGIPQSKVSCLMNGKLSAFSLDYLFELLHALDRNIEIIIKPKAKKQKSASTQVWLKAA